LCSVIRNTCGLTLELMCLRKPEPPGSGFLEINLECVITYFQCKRLLRSDQSAVCILYMLPLGWRHEDSDGPYQSARHIATSDPAPTCIRFVNYKLPKNSEPNETAFSSIRYVIWPNGRCNLKLKKTSWRLLTKFVRF